MSVPGCAMSSMLEGILEGSGDAEEAAWSIEGS